MQQLLNQVQELQNKVLQMSQQQQGGEGGGAPQQNFFGNGGGYNQPSNQSRPSYSQSGPDPVGGGKRILLVSNIPQSLANCDSVYFIFERFGTVERVKILHNKRDAALVQMASSDMADKAVNEQGTLHRTCPNIFVNFSNNITYVKLPQESGFPEDGLSRDYTGQFSSNANAGPGGDPGGPRGGSQQQHQLPPCPPPPSYHSGPDYNG